MEVAVLETYAVNLLVGDEARGLRMYGVPPGGWFDPVSRLVARRMLTGCTACVETVARLRAVTDTDTRVAVLTPGAEVRVGGSLHRGPCLCRWRAGEDLIVEPSGGRATVTWDGLSDSGLEPVGVPQRLPMAFAEGADVRLDPGLWPRVGRVRFVPYGETTAFAGQILAESDRVGVRIQAGLSGRPSLERSEPSDFGLIQETPDGTVLVHGPNGPTIGGYARLGTVIEADRSVLARAKHGDRIEFAPVSLAVAIEARAELYARIERTIAQVLLATM